MPDTRTFLLVVVGVMPDDMPLEAAATDILPGFTHSLVLGPLIRSTAIVTTELPPADAIRRAVDSVPHLKPSRVELVQ